MTPKEAMGAGFDSMAMASKREVTLDPTLDPESRLQYVEDSRLTLMVQLGAAGLKLRDVLRLRAESVVGLDVLAGEPLEIYINRRLVAKGEAVVVNERKLGIRLTDIVTPAERIGKNSDNAR